MVKACALQMAVRGGDQAVGVPEVGAERDVRGVRKLRSQMAGRFGSTIPQRPAADFLGSTIAHFHPLDLVRTDGRQPTPGPPLPPAPPKPSATFP